MNTAAAAIGKWPGILKHFGLSEEQLNGKHQACPDCGGKDRFRFANQDGGGNYYCGGCGHGDGFQLAQLVSGKGFKEVAQEIDQIVGNIKMGDIVGTDYERSRKLLVGISNNLKPVGNEVRQYLAGRGLSSCKNMRQHNSLYYYEDGKKLGAYPAMVCRLSTPSGELATYHCTYLNDGKKADVRASKKIMPVCASTRGGAIRLTDSYEHIGLAEGVETALAVMKLFKIPCWATATSGLMESFEPPEGIKSVTIYGDNDKNYAGQKSAYILANKLMLKGINVNVSLPNEIGDWNDCLLRGEK